MLFAAILYSDMFDYEVIPIHEVPKIMLDYPGSGGYIDTLPVPGEHVFVLCTGADSLELDRLASRAVVERFEIGLIANTQPHKYRKSG
ncbi:hypothetical protein GHT06_018602 [Daphnia sinensis]|uniref:Uncharacterized protein n=1 Tax=Daphnia sinensis TaxID=1820382 RepID=A0AAD5PUW0_9CRUS|nr:hypothetical protein GHT06_018602 [Daphnia sinensis]